MRLVWEKMVAANLIDVQKFVALTSTNAAKIFNLYPRKGSITVGADADLVIWNHHFNEVITAHPSHHANDYNIFQGIEVTGAPEYVIVKGKVCFEEGNIRVSEGYGSFLEMPPHNPYVYENDESDGVVDGFVDFHVLDQAQLDFEDLDYHPGKAESMKSTSTHATMHTAKGPRAEGVRDQQQSSFSISEELDQGPRKSGIRVHAPPGGASIGFW